MTPDRQVPIILGVNCYLTLLITRIKQLSLTKLKCLWQELLLISVFVLQNMVSVCQRQKQDRQIKKSFFEQVTSQQGHHHLLWQAWDSQESLLLSAAKGRADLGIT